MASPPKRSRTRDEMIGQADRVIERPNGRNARVTADVNVPRLDYDRETQEETEANLRYTL